LAALAGEVEPDDPRIIGFAEAREPAGFEDGLVTNLDAAVSSLEGMLERLIPGRGSHDLAVHVVLGNDRLGSYDCASSQYYQGAPRTISHHEIRQVIDQTRSIATLPLTQTLLQVVPECFLVNDLADIRNPLGLEAVRLGVQLKIFTMNYQDFKNIARAFETADIEVKGYWPKTLAVSEAVLTDEEKEVGVMLVDITDPGTRLILWKNGRLRASKTLPLGGRSLTRKIAETWSIEEHDAERVKERFAALTAVTEFGEELIPLVYRHGKGAHSIRRQEFHEKFLAFAGEWMEEILRGMDAFAQEEKTRYPHYVFTGGGTCLEGFLEFLQTRFARDARLGFSRRMEAPTELLVAPSLTGALGLFRWLATYAKDYDELLAPRGFFEKTISTARDWFCNYF